MGKREQKLFCALMKRVISLIDIVESSIDCIATQLLEISHINTNRQPFATLYHILIQFQTPKFFVEKALHTNHP